jgi:hypothetical protein
MTPNEAAAHLRKVGILPPSLLAPQHVAARTCLGRREDVPVSWNPVYLRHQGLLANAEPLKWPAKVKPLIETAAKVLDAYR